MNLGELIDSYRQESSDNRKPYLVSDAIVTQFANQAEQEACRRASLLVDSTSAFCSIDISAGDYLVQLDPSIINVRRAKLSISAYQLTPARAEEMDRVNPGWERHTGTPTTYVTDYQTGYIRLYPIINQSATLTMTVSRLPTDDMANTDDEPEIRKEYHSGLVNWILYRAYSKQDSDLFDANKAIASLRLFEGEFGQKASARNEQWMRDRTTIETPTIA